MTFSGASRTSRGGFEYEEALVRFLTPQGYSTGENARANDSIPDITLRNQNGVTAGCEVKKVESAAYGSATIYFKWNTLQADWKTNPTRSAPWGLKEYSSTEVQNLLYNVGVAGRLPAEINTRWWNNNLDTITGEPYVPWLRPTATMLNLPSGPDGTLGLPLDPDTAKHTQYLTDYNRLSEFDFPATAQLVREYYIQKGSLYIMIGGKGFYRMSNNSNQDPFQLANKGVPLFNPGQVFFRVRVQSKTSDKDLPLIERRGRMVHPTKNWRFTYDLYVKNTAPSGYSIGEPQGQNIRTNPQPDLTFLDS